MRLSPRSESAEILYVVPSNRIALVWLALVLACGRIGYDELAEGPDASVGEPGDAGDVRSASRDTGSVVASIDAAPPNIMPPSPDSGTAPGIDPPVERDASTPVAMDASTPVAMDANTPVEPVCPAVCNGGCGQGVCRITNPTVETTCAPGMPCEITCADARSCKVKLVCGAASTCNIKCLGDRACSEEIHCGTGPCAVNCDNDKTCSKVFCENAATCAVTCNGFQACGFPVNCGTSRCDVRCLGDSSCFGGVACTTACACDTTCNPSGCPGGPGAHQCISPECTRADGSCRSDGACSMCQ